MKPEDALDLLNQIRLQIQMSGKDHEMAKHAHETLKAFIASHAPAKTE